mgnify:CR=1 FL=1
MPVDYDYTGVEDANAVIHEELIEPSTFETIDYAFYDFLTGMSIRATTNKGWKSVPLVWSSAERVFFSKEKKDLRDLDGTLILPIMSVERTAMIRAMAAE